MAGRGEELKGSIKEQAGKLLGNEQWQAEGKAERLKGKSKRAAAGMKNEAAGALKEAAGRVAGDEELEVEGKAQRIQGKAQRAD